MLRNNRNNPVLYVLLLVIVIFVAGRLWGSSLFDNNWSFNHWESLSGWYIFLWFSLLVLTALLFASLGERIALFFNSRLRVIVASAVMFGLLLLFQFDSFLYSGGNLRIAQVAQTDTVIYRWFEYGAILTVSWLNTFFSLFDIHYNAAGVYAWKVFSFACTFLSLVAALKLAKELTADATSRFYLFLILFFGPHTILHFGFVGVEPVLIAVSIWFSLAAVRLSAHFTTKHLLALWVIVLIGLFMHYTSIYLLPAAVYATVLGRKRKGKSHAIALAAGLGSYVGLLVLAYYLAGQNLEFSKFVLFLAGKLPHSDYGIFSSRHIGDMLQIFFLAFPQIIVVAYLIFTRYRVSTNKSNLLLPLWLLLGLGGVTVVLILDPVHNIVLDYPRLTAYLFPLSIVLALQVKEHKNHSRDRLVALLAAVCLIFPLSYLPNYVRIAKADPYVTDYLDKHDSFYLDGCLAFRDAYFYRKELDEANAWEWKLPSKSPDYLNLEGVKALATQGEEAEALRSLYKIIAKNPYWSEARAVFVSIQMKPGRYALAKPQIDTCLMLDPYRKEYLMNLYRYYRDTQSYPQALKSIKKVLKIFPDDLDLRTDLMIVYYRSGAPRTADSLADALLAADSTLPYPYLIKGLIAETHNERQVAIALYKKFVALAPNEPDTPAIQERLNELMWEMEEE